VRLDGFRPGKAPRPVLERLYKHSVEDDVARELVELSIVQAIREKQLEPVAPPAVDRIDLKAGQPFKFSARVEVRSQVEPKDYSGIPVERRAAKVADEEITSAL
jgi:trigger factor